MSAGIAVSVATGPMSVNHEVVVVVMEAEGEADQEDAEADLRK